MKGVTLYIEPFSGASGDMLLSALCALHGDFERIVSLPDRLHLHDGKVEVREVEKNGIVCKHVKIIDLNESKDPAEDHDHHHSHSHDHHDHHHSHDHHDHHHSHTHSHHSDHVHRGLKEIIGIIDAGHISESAKRIAKEIFQLIGESEAAVHNIPIEKIHFHEISAVDSILDIVGCAEMLDFLNIQKVYCDPICTGYGSVKTQHGMLPVPAPATRDLLEGMPYYKGNEKGEKLTPTGAAILKYLRPDFQIPVMNAGKTAYGPGEKDFIQPNVVRISIVKEVAQKTASSGDSETMWMIECNIDDESSEYLGIDFQSELMNHGATDYTISPCTMKKGRPGLLMSVMVEEDHRDQVASFILENTSTIGVRFYKVERMILPRRSYSVETSYGPVRVKEVSTPSGSKRWKVEFESLSQIRQDTGLTINEIERKVYSEIYSKQS
jgi:uncharacterized protein (TIGR00299 family) protein